MLLNFIFAFLIGGSLCLIAQIIIDNTKLTPGHVTSMFVVAGSFLEFIGLYEKIRKIGGIGASLPISSFGSLIMKGIKEKVDALGFIGIFEGVFCNVGGIISLALFLACIASFFIKPKS